jgi:ribosome-associated translation inhibitor RaiA
MNTTITSRHGEIPDDLRARAMTILERLGHLSPHALEGSAIFDSAPVDTVELKLHVRGGQILVSEATAADPRTALDLADAKIKAQLERAVATVRGDRRPPGQPS